MTGHPPQIVHAVRRLKGQGASNTDIGMSVGLTEAQIRTLCHTHGIRRATSGRLDLPIGPKLMEIYHAEAARRGVKFENFMRKLLLTIVTDKLLTAILDDEK